MLIFWKSLPRSAQAALALSLVFFTAYLFSQGTAYDARPLVKGLAVGLLAVFSRHPALGAPMGLTLALIFSTAGDVFLALPAGWLGVTDFFIFGLGAFLLGHLAYVVVFMGRRGPAGRAQKAGLFVLAIYGVFLVVLLKPGLGDLLIPVMIYAAALIAMGASALLSRFGGSWVAVGALLFIGSDSVLAIDRFLDPVQGANWIIWPAYYAGQLLITLGVVRFKHCTCDPAER